MKPIVCFLNKIKKRGCLKSQSPLANFGCGSTIHKGWDNFDFKSTAPGVRKVNLLRSLPFDGGIYEMVYTSHVLEHLPRDQIELVLSEFHRILRPAGILRVVVPDLESMAKEYLAQLDAVDRADGEAGDRHAWICMELLDQFVRRQSGGFMARWWQSKPMPAREYVLGRGGQEAMSWAETGAPSLPFLRPDDIYQAPGLNARRERRFAKSGERHMWAYDRVSLRALLENCNFGAVRICSAEESYLPNFASFALDTTADGHIRKPGSLFMEAKKNKDSKT